MDTITGPVISVIRKGHTIYGNPIIEVGIGSDTRTWEWFRISDNASLVYEIENAVFKDEPHTFALTRAGRISHVIR